MALYAIRRLGLALVIVICAMAVLFGMIHLMPGDPITIALGPRATEAMRQAYLAKMRLDQPLHVQFLAFAGGVLRGDLGADVFSNRSVTTIVLEQLPYTLALTGAGLGWAVAARHPARLLLGDPAQQLVRQAHRRDLGRRDRDPVLRRRDLRRCCLRGLAPLAAGDRRGRAGRSRSTSCST